MKKKLAFFLALLMVLSTLPIQSFADVTIGSDDDGPIVVSGIEYAITHDVFTVESGYLQIEGSNLKGVPILFYKSGLGYDEAGQRTIDSDNLIQYRFTKEEITSLTGKLSVGGTPFDIQSAGFPNLQKSDKATVMTGAGVTDSITFTGVGLDLINDGSSDVTGTFGTASLTKPLDLATNSTTLTLNNPTPPGRLGAQDIILSKDSNTSGVNISIRYTYSNVFRIVEDLGAGEITMYPNTGAKGDEVYFTSDNFSDTKNYQVYFVKSLDGSDKYTEVNRAEFVSLGLNVDGNQDRLTVKVPTSADFERRNYYVVITDNLNGQIVAEQVVMRDIGTPSEAPDEYTVIESGYKPTIEAIYPTKGPDTGGTVQISGRNLITLNIPDLVSTGAITGSPTADASGSELEIIYANGTYKNEAVKITRHLNVQIGKKTTFAKDDSTGEYRVNKGIPDTMMVETAIIDDAATDPFKDVVVEMETTLEVTSGPNTGKKYIFNQVVTREDGFEFEPSTYTPIVDDMLPNMIQVEDRAGGYVQFSNETLIAIHGDNFLVDRYVDGSGNIITRYPTILVKKNDNNTSVDRYQLGFFPNETETLGGQTVTGVIRYKDDEADAAWQTLTDGSGAPVPLDLVVLDADNNEVTGVRGNDIGTKIVIKVPENTPIKDIGIKHLQVTNPRRDSDIYGNSSIRSDFMEFVKTSDVPVIESVDPKIVTVEGDEEITVVGSNIQDGVRIFLDGEEITDFTRELDTTGTKIVVKFTAPPGREGLTQLQLMNPSGGMAVSDFIYVDTFNEAPEIASFTPTTGSYETLVVVNGNNFLKPDPTASNIEGINAYRLTGTRVLLDGQEVNEYNYDIYGNVTFLPFSVPDTLPLITTNASKAVYSHLYQNTTVTDTSDGTVVTLGQDDYHNPAIVTKTESYAIRYESGSYNAYDSTGTLVGAVNLNFNSGSGETTIAITGGPTFVAAMDNNIIRKGTNTDGVEVPFLADYAESVILTDGVGNFFTLSENFSGDLVLTNGKDQVYTVIVNSSGNLVAVDGNANQKPILLNGNGFELDGTPMTMQTAYQIDATTGAITGQRVKVLSKNQLVFTVPYLASGKGYKDLVVVNPDTKNDGRYEEEGFYYVSQPTSSPAITKIDPNKGSVDGGYFVRIEGHDFEDDIKVYVDAQLVPAEDTYVALDGSYIKILMPASLKDLVGEYGVDAMDVPVVVVNADGGADSLLKGFTYIIPQSDPQITSVLPVDGSSNGGEIVEIVGYEFRFYEPYENLVGGPSYDIGDRYDDLYPNGTWDDLLSPSVDPGAIQTLPELTNDYYSEYYESRLLPKVYFGENEAHIVEYAKGYLKVITPTHTAGTVDVYVINNDSGVSNKVKFNFEQSSPNISKLTPDFGKRSGGEPKDIYGSSLYKSILYGYKDDDETLIQLLGNVDALVRFGEIDNRDIARNEINSGLINSQRTTVNLEGGLMVNYYGDLGQVKVTLTQNNIIYSRTFDYDNSTVYVPTGMLQDASGDYFVPDGLKGVDASVYSGNAYELIKLTIEDRRLFVERGYAPEVNYDNAGHVQVYTPPYYTIDPVQMTYYNPDGGSTQHGFTYTNPASEPKILTIEPKTLNVDETKWYVESSITGGVDIEIVGEDFRENAIVYIGDVQATVKEVTTKDVNGTTYDLIVATVPAATINDVDQEYPFMIENEDKGLATSSNLNDLIGTNYGSETLPFYFVYKKPLSNPRIDTVTPAYTSVYGGNTITLVGSDFRPGAYVVIGTRAGIPINNVNISADGTTLTFTTPNNMSIGEKNIQVLNNDYGIAVKENGITVVSAPTVNPIITDENGHQVNHIDVTGGEKITLTGTQFQEGATVYFGGKWTKSAERVTDTLPADGGIYRDDDLYTVVDGIESPTVEFVDATTLIVTTPEVDYEDDIRIVVLNPDGGISNDDAGNKYTVPIPDDPVGLKVTVVDNRYIKLYDYVSEDSNYFEIYVYIGTKTDSQLAYSENYKSFNYLGVTDIEPYKITELPGIEDMSTADRIVFVLKGVNKFGASGWSNVASLTYKDLKDIESLGPEDTDGDLGAPEGEDIEVIPGNQTITVNLGEAPLSPVVSEDLSADMRKDTSQKIITLPKSIVLTSLSSVTLDFGDTAYHFVPVAFSTNTFRQMSNYYDSYAQLKENSLMDSKRSYLIPQMRGKKQVGRVYSISFGAATNYTQNSMDTLVSPIDFAIRYDDTYMTSARESQITLYKYNPSTRSYDPVSGAVLNTNKNTVSTRLTQAGHYVLLTNY